MKSFRKGSRKLLKSLAHEISDCAVSCDFKGLRRVLFRAPVPPGLFLPVRRARKANLSYQDLILARIRFKRKITRTERMSACKLKFAAFVRVHGIDHLGP